MEGCKRRARVGEGRSARHLAALRLRCPRPEDPEPTVASVSGVWAVGRSGSCGGAGHSQARTAPSRRNVGADAVRVLRSPWLLAMGSSHSNTRVLNGSLDPPGRQDYAVRRADLGAAPAEEVRSARKRLFEEALLLERLAKDHPQHLGVAGVLHRVDARGPAIDEGRRVAGVLLDHVMARVSGTARD